MVSPDLSPKAQEPGVVNVQVQEKMDVLAQGSNLLFLYLFVLSRPSDLDFALSCLFGILIQMLVSARNMLTDTARNNVLSTL